jgi:hypothetical protein
MFCAAIPAAAAAGARLHAGQLKREEGRRLPVARWTGLVVLLLLAGSITYHTLTFRS